ncbi:MAG TPA: hypothetical protein PLD20_19990 [Blastocatellia bacterium]|nr:hypothetical protein [Blastocatellia bacterium]HMZ20229.1 hypothetical protein [Blastocatellia bacterium]HNG28581.1 hypothetical protein [Blastocatellia bacterium]
MKAVLLIPDGVGVRNFLIGPFMHLAEELDECHVLHGIPDALLPKYRNGNQNVGWHPLLPYTETPLSSVLRYAIAFAHMNWGDTQAMRYVRNRPINGSWRRRGVQYTAKLTGRLAASPAGIQALDRWHCSVVEHVPEVERYRQLFERIKPNVVFCSHQRPPIVLPATLAARSLGIPTATFIFSWDNLTSKGRIAAPFDHFLVWSELMREELLRFYPDVTPGRVHVVGTPQFDPYATPELQWSREEFFTRVGADLSRPLLCYSGGDTGTAPEDHLHIRALMELIRGGEIKGNPQVLLRPAPVDDGARYDEVRRDYPELLYAAPAWIHTDPGNWASVVPSADDVQFLANLTRHADININLASTMTLDFAIHDRPVVNIAFDMADPPIHGKPLWDYYYQFEHYQTVVKIGAARFARTRTELATHVNAYLENPALDREARRKLVEVEVGLPIGQSSRKIIETLRQISK